MYDEDTETLENVKRFSARKKKSFSSTINSKNLSEEELDDLFLSYWSKMARIRRSKTNTTYFMDIPKCDQNGKKWKKSDDDEALDVRKE